MLSNDFWYLWKIYARIFAVFANVGQVYENETKQKFPYRQIQEFLYKRCLIFDEKVIFSCCASCKNNSEPTLLSHK